MNTALGNPLGLIGVMAAAIDKADAGIAALERDTDKLIERAIAREKNAIAVSRSTVDARNKDRWSALTDWLTVRRIVVPPDT